MIAVTEVFMVSAIVLLTVEREKINDVANEIVDIDGVTEVYSVAGRYDLAAIARVKNNDDLAVVVTEKIRKVEGITSSETLIAFRVYSRHDLERMFSIGIESGPQKTRSSRRRSRA
jgi:DNA-binding Lrp family transcriptional regulator